MTLSEMVDYVRNRHNAIGDSNWSDEEIYRLVEARSNEVLSIVGLVETKDTSITTVASTESYSYPTDMIFIKQVEYDGDALQKISLRQWNIRKVSGTTPEGTPDYYFLWNDLIYLIPTPSAAATVTIWGEKQQSGLTLSTDTIDAPAVLHLRLADGVIGDMYTKDLNAQMAQIFEKRWVEKHVPAFQQYRRKRRRSGKYAVTVDSDTFTETDFGVT